MSESTSDQEGSVLCARSARGVLLILLRVDGCAYHAAAVSEFCGKDLRNHTQIGGVEIGPNSVTSHSMAGLLQPATRSACRLRADKFFSIPLSPFTRASPSFFHSSATRLRSIIQWTPEIDSRISQLYAEGHTWKQIGESLNILAVSCHRRYHAHIAPNLSNFWTPKRNQRLLELALEGDKSWTEIAKVLCASTSEDNGQQRLITTKARKVDNGITGIACQQQFHRIARQEQSPKHNLRRQDGDLLLGYMKAQASRSQGSGRSEVNWERVARDLFKGQFTARQIQYHYARLLQGQRRWTKQENDILTTHVMASLDKDGHLGEHTWLEAVKQLDPHPSHHQSPEDCEDRWKLLERRLTKRYMITVNGNYWSDDEIRAYWVAWQRFGNDWDRVAQAVQSIPAKDETILDSTLPAKTSKDCKDDFQFLTIISIPMAGHLKKAIGELAQCFSGQPPKRPEWTQEQLGRLELAVELESGSSTVMTDSNWKAVAKRVGNGITKAQCRYRWSVMQAEKGVKQTDDANEGRWSLEDTMALERALRDLRLLGSKNPLTPRFSTFVQKEYHIKRSLPSIRYKAQRILKDNLPQPSPELSFKRRLYLQALLPQGEGRASVPDSHLTPDAVEPQDKPGSESEGSNGDLWSRINSMSDDDATTLPDEKYEEDLGRLHPSMFIAPGILKADVQMQVLTTGHKPSHVRWKPEDEEKLEELVEKYGQSTLAWKQIALEMSIPLRKCKDKWRNMNMSSARK